MAYTLHTLNKLEKDCELSMTKQPDTLSTAVKTFGATSTQAFKDLSRAVLDPSYKPGDPKTAEEHEDDEARVKAMEEEMLT
jgi:hypothetical protein